MHELLMTVAGMHLKSEFLAEVFVLRSMGNELVPSPHYPLEIHKVSESQFVCFILTFLDSQPKRANVITLKCTFCQKEMIMMLLQNISQSGIKLQKKQSANEF